ncbi:MAG: GNAT family N-acetyltransferase [Pseudomonadota bacterium]
MVVTWLDMSERPPLSPAPAPEGSQVVHWERPELEAYRALIRKIGADWLWFGRLTLSDGELARQIRGKGVEIHRLMKGDDAIGIAELKFRPGKCELSFFGVTAEYIGTTAGRHLMEAAIARAWSEPISRFFLQTCTLDSPKALEFYRRSGFVAYDRAVEVKPDPRLRGILPREAARHIPVIE